MTLCDAVAHIGGKIAGRLAAVIVDRLHSLLDELIQMGAAGWLSPKVLSTMIWGLERSSTFQPIPIFSGSFSGAKVRTSCERNSIFIPPNTACFRPFSAGPFCGFIVNPQTSFCKLSRVCPTFCAKTLGYIMHTAQIRAIFAQNQPSKRLLRKKKRKSHLMTLRRTLSVKAFPAAPRFRRKQRCSCRFPSRPHP